MWSDPLEQHIISRSSDRTTRIWDTKTSAVRRRTLARTLAQPKYGFAFDRGFCVSQLARSDESEKGRRRGSAEKRPRPSGLAYITTSSSKFLAEYSVQGFVATCFLCVQEK